MITENDFARVVNETKSVVLSAVEKHLSQRHYHAIDDVVQETYLRAYRSLVKNKFRGDSAVTSWLYSIARNESYRMNKKLEREEEKFHKSVDAIGRQDAMIHTDKDHLEVKELVEKIGLLPDKYRSVIKLVSEGYSEKDIAQTLSIKKGTVKSRTSRGREMLKKIYDGEKQ